MAQLYGNSTVENFPGAFGTEYVIVKRHERDAGQAQLPVASASGTESCEIVDLHDPVEVLAVYWKATKRGGPPVVPSPYSFNIDHVFLNGSRGAASPVTTESGQCHDWEMEGVFYYALTTPYDLNSPFAAPTMPVDTITPDQAVIPAGNFSTKLLAPQKQLPQTAPPILQTSIPKTTA